MAQKWRILYNALPADRRKTIESWVNGFRARANGESLDSGMADHDWADGWAEADETLLGKWALENNIGSGVE